MAHGLSCSVACGIFPDQGSNPCPLHWQEESQPPCHQGSPELYVSIQTNLQDTLFCEKTEVQDSVYRMLLFGYSICILMQAWNISAKDTQMPGENDCLQGGALRD